MFSDTMGAARSSSSNDERLREKQYYTDSGKIHVSEFGGLVNYCHDWPLPPPNVPRDNVTVLGRWFCDANGISRQGDWCAIGAFSARMPHLYEDINHYCLAHEKTAAS